jgi:hypothetical protein
MARRIACVLTATGTARTKNMVLPAVLLVRGTGIEVGLKRVSMIR